MEKRLLNITETAEYLGLNGTTQKFNSTVGEPMKLEEKNQVILCQRAKYSKIDNIAKLLFEKLVFEGFGLEKSVQKEMKMKLIKPKSKKFWYIDFVANGKRNRWSTKCEKKSEAELVKKRLLIQIASSESNNRTERIKQEHTLEESINKYLAEYSRGIKLSYKRDLLSAKNLLRDIGNLKLSEITPEIIYSWQQKRKKAMFKNGKNISYRTINIERSFLHRVLELAKNQWNWIEKNPVTIIFPLPYDGARNKYFTENEKATLLSLCEEFQFYWFRDILEFLWLTGFRIGEVLSLTCGQVFLNTKTPYINLKREKSRIIMDYPIERERVKSILIKNCSGKADSQPVFTYNGKIIKYQQIRSCWEKVRKAAGLKDSRLHDCRHTFATECYDAEIDDMTIKELLGQKTIQTTRRYIHPQLETLGKRIKKMEKRESFGTLLAPFSKNEVLTST